MERLKHEQHGKIEASFMMSSDYMNTHVAILEMLSGSENVIEIMKKDGKWPPIKSFTEFYKKTPLNVTEADREKIDQLDKLSEEANRILNEPTIDKRAFIILCIKVAKICGKHDMSERLEKSINE